MRLSLIVCLLLAMHPASAKGWWETMTSNIKKALTPSKFICDRYEQRPYEIKVRRPNTKLPFTEIKPKKRHCIKWEPAPKSAIGKSCVEYSYENTSPQEDEQKYQRVTRYRTVCVEGHRVP